MVLSFGRHSTKIFLKGKPVLFSRLKIPMKGTRYDDISTMQAAVLRVLKAISKAGL
ncbi:hypothetical protein WH47_08085 [Habropoda laboriosa]|uniref:Uncharacterized protein n=1 Tax=Habropoda laboriosa TaxID=597456 RepID=A0A0L7RHH8_9HYME|nr:hypothetical protein WH47_08085 [Habropoda laboriosa]